MKHALASTAAAAALLLTASLLSAQPEQKDKHPMMPMHPPERPLKPVTFLGVETRPVSPTLTEQLGLPRGIGLIVLSIVPDSPAAGALKQHDIVTKLDDQLLIDTHQLAVLVRSHKQGDEITLTYVRTGKEATARIKLTEREMPEAFDFPMRRRMNQRMIQGHLLPGGGDPMMRQLGPGLERGQSLRIIRKGSAGSAKATAVLPAQGQLLFSDEKGSLAVTAQDGTRTLVAKDPEGTTLFEGPVTTTEEQKALPEDVRQRFEQMQKLDHVSFADTRHLIDAAPLEGAEDEAVFPPSDPI